MAVGELGLLPAVGCDGCLWLCASGTCAMKGGWRWNKATQATRDARIWQMRVNGSKEREIAAEFNITVARVSQIISQILDRQAKALSDAQISGDLTCQPVSQASP